MKDYKNCTVLKKQIDDTFIVNALGLTTIAAVITMVLFQIPVQL